ncbi:hypothetical protein CIK05_03120 [Bdellovibrio sp. qaytius]|nr:hypothetical protein CIK05_03120 [Bdellovibrio sp. qaytius]
MKTIFRSLLALFTISFLIVTFAEAKVEKPAPSLIWRTANEAYATFETDALNSSQSLDYVFLKLEKKINFQLLTEKELEILNFDVLTQKVLLFVNRSNFTFNLPINNKLRKQMQFEFYGLSQAIKKANEMNLTVQAEHFDKLHDMLMGQSSSLFYTSAKDKKKTDLFFTAYYLNELEYPMDMTARHLEALKKTSNWNYNTKVYASKLARLSLQGGTQLNKLTAKQVDVLYEASLLTPLDDKAKQAIQKIYLKQLQMIGDQEKIKEVKRVLASNMLGQETKNVIAHPFEILKYIQFCVGYIFIAWPLEVILVVVSILIFGFQASHVLTEQEKRKKSIGKKMWLVFQKAYLGSNVPFFTKLAASLILFGVGLYFNSAKNFVETMMTNM